MKKISKIKISGGSIKTKWYIWLLVAVLACALIVMTAVLTKLYFDVNQDSGSNPVPDSNIIADFDDVKNNYVIFSGEDGLSGIKDVNGRYIIEPRWNNIYFLCNDRFAVEQKNGNNTEIAVVDSEENFITPFIFRDISLIGSDFLAGNFISQEGFALLDTCGNIILDKIWTDSEYDETSETVTLTNQTGKYSYKYENNLLICTGIAFNSMVSGCDVSCFSDDKTLIEDISPDRMYNMFDSACIYFSSLLSENKTDISEITNEQFIDTLSANSLFRNCTVKNIKNIQIQPDENGSVGYMFSAEVLYNYDGEEVSIENLKSLVSLHFVEDENHKIILKSVNKKEI